MARAHEACAWLAAICFCIPGAASSPCETWINAMDEMKSLMVDLARELSWLSEMVQHISDRQQRLEREWERASVTVKGYRDDKQSRTKKPSIFSSQKPSITTVNHTSPAEYLYTPLKKDLTNVSWITFAVTACSDAHLSLQPTVDNITENTYEFVIGANGNDYAALRNNIYHGDGDDLVLVLGRFLDCIIPKPMWISWTAGNLRFGIGSFVGQQVVINFTDANLYTVKGIALSAYTGVTAMWSVNIPGPN